MTTAAHNKPPSAARGGMQDPWSWLGAGHRPAQYAPTEIYRVYNLCCTRKTLLENGSGQEAARVALNISRCVRENRSRLKVVS